MKFYCRSCLYDLVTCKNMFLFAQYLCMFIIYSHQTARFLSYFIIQDENLQTSDLFEMGNTTLQTLLEKRMTINSDGINVSWNLVFCIYFSMFFFLTLSFMYNLAFVVNYLFYVLHTYGISEIVENETNLLTCDH